MSGSTRIARFGGGEPGARPQSGIGTLVFGGPPQPTRVGPRETYLALHRVIRNACAEERRPGAFLFAATVGGGAVGRLWLAATPEPRAGTLGRHEAVDLPLSPDAALSLRHLLFVVRTVNGRVRFSAIDLETPAGVHTRHGSEHRCEGEGPMLLRTSQLLFFCAPTGPTCAVPMDPLSAWTAFDSAPRPQAPSLFRELLSRPGSAVGQLTLMHEGRPLPLTVDQPMLERGVLLGRQQRCDVIIPDNFASRVHAVVLSIDGVPHLVNTGSSNGTWHSSRVPVKCWRLREGDTFWLGNSTVQWKLATR